MSYMFSGCNKLTSIEMLSKNNSKIIIEIREGDSNKLISIPLSSESESDYFSSLYENDESYFKEKCDSFISTGIASIFKNQYLNPNVISYRFQKDDSISPFLISNKVTDMSHMFSGCYSLKSLPDMSNWNTKNVTNMSYMFCGCESLISLPDISNWDTRNIIDMSRMFERCNFLIAFPDISNWNTTNLRNMFLMFFNCSPLMMLPDISK